MKRLLRDLSVLMLVTLLACGLDRLGVYAALAERLLLQFPGDSPEVLAADYLSEEKGVASVEEALAGNNLLLMAYARENVPAMMACSSTEGIETT